VGNDIKPNTDLEVIFSLVSIIGGVFLYSIMLGATSSALSSIDEGDSNMRKQMDSLSNFLRNKKVGVELQKRIQENLKYLWSSHQSFNVTNQWFLRGVHPLLKLELTLDINKKYLERVSQSKKNNYLKNTNKFLLLLQGPYV
jgi:hypothetical protein